MRMKKRTDIGYPISNIYYSLVVHTELNLMRLEKPISGCMKAM